MIKNWYSLGNYERTECTNCSKEQSNIASLDHHPMICPNCQIECIWYDLGSGRTIQIVPSLAPIEFRLFIKWSQKELDELEFLELIMAFEELGQAIKK